MSEGDRRADTGDAATTVEPRGYLMSRPATRWAVALTLALLLLGLAASTALAGRSLSPLEELGKALFFDTNLSTPPGQSCAACHAPEVGFTGPDPEINAGGRRVPGRGPGRFGNRKPPAAAYAGDSPILYYDDDEGSGSAACSGTAAPPAGRSATRSPSRPRDRS